MRDHPVKPLGGGVIPQGSILTPKFSHQEKQSVYLFRETLLGTGLDKRVLPDQIKMSFKVDGIHPSCRREHPGKPRSIVEIIPFIEKDLVLCQQGCLEQKRPDITGYAKSFRHKGTAIHQLGRIVRRLGALAGLGRLILLVDFRITKTQNIQILLFHLLKKTSDTVLQNIVIWINKINILSRRPS